MLVGTLWRFASRWQIVDDWDSGVVLCYGKEVQIVADQTLLSGDDGSTSSMNAEIDQ